MASSEGGQAETLYPNVAMYANCAVRGLRQGDVKLWCRCGLSKTQPWCDGSHEGTGFQPLRWIVPKTQSTFYLCACKYTAYPPNCSGECLKLPTEVLERIEKCSVKETHQKDCKLCTKCGWAPDFWTFYMISEKSKKDEYTYCFCFIIHKEHDCD